MPDRQEIKCASNNATLQSTGSTSRRWGCPWSAKTLSSANSCPGYQHGMLRFVRAAQALMPLTIAGDAPLEEQVAAWEQQVEEKRREVMQAEV